MVILSFRHLALYYIFYFLIIRLGSNGILGTSLESLSPLKAFPTTTITPPRRASENTDSAGVSGCCPQCTQNYEQELADILKENEKSDTESKSEAARPALPQWLQKATNNDNAKVMDQAQVNFIKNKLKTPVEVLSNNFG